MAGLRRAAGRGRALERRPRPAASARPRRALRALAAAALLALPLLAALAPAAQAQDTLVSNTGQPLLLNTGNQVAVAFTTGSNGYGYTLSAVDIPLQTVSSRDTVVTIRAGGGANPGALVATLANPSSFTRDALNTFTAPAGTTLAASTTYFLVVNDGRNLAAANVVLTVTTSNAQTGAAGWSIADAGRFVSNGNWINGPGIGTSIRFALKGAPNGPAAPTGLTATAGPGSREVTLRWTDPGDSRITGYQYDSRVNNTGPWPGWKNFSSGGGRGATEGRISDRLTNGTLYGFRVRARAGALAGLASDAATATPAANIPPFKPAGLTATAGDGRVALSWDNPRDSRITAYEVRTRESGGSWGAWYSVASGSTAASVTSIFVTGLTNGTAYDLQIRARAGSLLSPNSDTVSATPQPPPPAKPMGLTATAGDRSVTLRWTNPNNSDITRWQFRFRAGSDNWAGWFGISGSDADTMSVRIRTGLTNGTEYSFQIRAVAGTVFGAASDTVSATPTAPAVQFADDSAASLSEGASFARGYTLVLDPAPAAAITVTYTVTGTATRGTDFTTSGSAAVGAGIDEVDISVAVVQDALREGDETVILTLADGAGYDLGGRTTVTLTIEDDDPPLAPAGFAAAAGDGQVVLSWTDPSDAAISGYQFRRRTPPDTGSWGSWTAIAGSTAATTAHTVTGLTNGTAYGFQVRAVDGTLEGAASSEATATPTAAATAGVTTAQPTDRQVTEGDTSDTATFTVALSTRPSDTVSVTVTAPAGLELAGPGGSTFSGSATLAFTASTWNSAQTVTMRATDDSTDSPIGRELSVTYRTSSRDSSYNSLSGTAATVTVADNDPTAVTLAGAAGDVAEGGTKTFTVTLGRGLVNGEALPVPLTFGGGATRGADYTTACPTTLPTGVACANLDSGNATVTFTGPTTGTTATTVTLTLTAAADNTAEPGGETVVIGLGTLNANSGTGLGGGASGADSLADFRITDPDTGAPTVEITGVPDRISGTGDITATFTFSEDVTGFATDDVTVTGGTKGTFTATSATVYTLAVTPDGGADVVVTVAANAATDGTNTGPASAETATAVWTALVFSSTAVTVVEEASATYTVALSSRPDGNVTVTVAGASGEVTFDTDSTAPGNQSTLTFNAGNWSTAKTVTVSAGEDNDTSNDSATLTHTAAGGGYGSATGSVAVTVADNDAPGLVLDPTSLTVAEGGSGTYTVALATRPTGTVTVTVGGASGEVTFDTDSTTPGTQTTALTFSTTNWSTARTVTVLAGEDGDTANDSATLTHSASGGGYGSVTGSVAVTVDDNDAPAAAPPTGLAAAAGNGRAVLSWTAPASDEITKWQYQLLENTRWRDIPESDATTRSHTVTGLVNGLTYNIRVRAVSGAVNGRPSAPVGVRPLFGVAVLSPTSLTVAEGGSASYRVRLSAEPRGTPNTNVIVGISSSNSDITVAPAELDFTVSNWNEPRTVTVSASQDNDAVHDRATLSHSVQGGGYTAGSGPDLNLVVNDDESGAPPPPQPPSSGGGGSSGGGSSGGGGGGGGRRPEAPEALEARSVPSGGALALDLSAAFRSPGGGALSFTATSSEPAVASVSVEGAVLTVRGLLPGVAEVAVTATDGAGRSISQRFALTVTAPEAAWYLPPAADPFLQGFVRVVNHSAAAGEVAVTATDDAGRQYAPLTLRLGPRAAAHFNSDDLEAGNAAKGLSGGVGPGAGGWRLSFGGGALDAEAIGLLRTADGFVTAMAATAPRDADGALRLLTFNPASNTNQASRLRLVNPTDAEARATVTGTDDSGASPGSPVALTLPAGAACEVGAAALESGRGLACGAPQAGLGDGAGKWRLSIASAAPLAAMGLLSSPGGHLTNLSAALPEGAGGAVRVPLFPSASDPRGRQGFVRVANRSGRAGTVAVRAFDDGGRVRERLSLRLGAREAKQFNSDDLELGAPAKGLSGRTGSGTGAWRLELSSADLDFEAGAYVRHADGFLTAMPAAAPSQDGVHRVATFNPGGNANQASRLRLVNWGPRAATATVTGADDRGVRLGAPVEVSVPAGSAVELAAAELESGEAAAIASGALGDGAGKWRLRVASDADLSVASLVSSPMGRLADWSGADESRGAPPLPSLPAPPASVRLEDAGGRRVRGEWDAVPGMRYGVELLLDGAPLEGRSLARAARTSFRWSGLAPGAYALRVRSVDADGKAGPWSPPTDEVVID